MAGEPVTSVDGTVDTHVRPGMLDKPGIPDKLCGQADAEHTPQEINDVLLVTPARNKSEGRVHVAGPEVGQGEPVQRAPQDDPGALGLEGPPVREAGRHYPGRVRRIPVRFKDYELELSSVTGTRS